MLDELHVHGTGGIKDAELTFSGSFIVITGESGSGKSSLVRALEFITGKRAQSSSIHALSDSSDVSAVVTADHIDGLEEEYQPQDGTLIAHRVFSRSGRGRCTLQGQPVPLSILTSVMEKEVVIQSQFAQLGLLDPAKQLELVDSCGGEALADTRAKLEKNFGEAIALERAIIAMKKMRAETEARYENSESITRQVRSLELTAESETEWEKELKELDARTAKAEALRSLADSFAGGASEDGTLAALDGLCKAIYSIVDDKNPAWRENGEKMLSAAQELSRLLQRETASLGTAESMEEAGEKIEKKLGMLRKIKRSLNLPSCAHVIEYAKDAAEAITWLRSSREELAAMESEASHKRREITRLAVELRAMRKDAAKKLAASVNSQLNDLAMEYADFVIEIEELDKVRASGAENAVFMLRLPDQSPLPVSRIASGGELSRILIALQLSLGDEKLPGTLVFDEVEAGLGGKTALLAGYKLRELSRRCRTILITHEATIAAMADCHFLVTRSGDETYISRISGVGREKEIARMLAGDDTSQQALDHARSLLLQNR